MTRLSFLLLPTLAGAHFLLNSPSAVGPFDEDAEATAPCGGVDIDFSKDNVTDFHVDGEALELFLSHPQANWLFRVTTDQNATSNWTQIYPVVMQTGEGDYCQSAVAAPASLAGQQGLLGVVVNGPDGLLYQCATVNFVAGMGTLSTSSCKNASSVKAAFASDPSLTALVSKDASQTNGTTMTSSDMGSMNSTSVASGLAHSGQGILATLSAVFIAALLGAGLML